METLFFFLGGFIFLVVLCAAFGLAVKTGL